MQWIKKFLNFINIFKGFMKPIPVKIKRIESWSNWQEVKVSDEIREEKEEFSFQDPVSTHHLRVEEKEEEAPRPVIILEPVTLTSIMQREKEPELVVMQEIKIEETPVLPTPGHEPELKEEPVKEKVIRKKRAVKPKAKKITKTKTNATLRKPKRTTKTSSAPKRRTATHTRRSRSGQDQDSHL